MVTANPTRGGLSQKEREALTSFIRDDVAYIERCMKIGPKMGGPLVPLKLYPHQQRLLRQATGRDILIKDSQVGATSAIDALILKRTITTPNTTSIIVAHEEFLTGRLLRRVRTFLYSIPEQVRPRIDHSSTYEIRFPDIESVLYIGTARSQVFGRGEPIHYLHLSEEAFYVEGAYERIILPALQRVPPGGMVFRESTPNGESGSFYEEVQKALKGESTFKLHTMYWWENPDNYMQVDDQLLVNVPSLAKRLVYTAEEHGLKRTHNLNMGQIRWRRYRVQESGAMFWQEHLESLDTCFLTVGLPYYDAAIVTKASMGSYPAPHIGPWGALVWEEPDPSGMYIMGLDPGEGKQTESVASVWRLDGEVTLHVARMSGLYEYEAMSRRSVDLARHYNNALIVPEANAHGVATIAFIKQQPSVRVYMRRDTISGRTGMHPGWLTSGRTKPYMMQELQRRMHTFVSYDKVLWSQIGGFRELGGGKVGSIMADDHHDAACLAMVGSVGMGPSLERGYVGNAGWNI